MNRPGGWLSGVLVALLVGCASTGTAVRDGGKLQQVIGETCFEVVVERVQEDSLSYERELPWDRLPYNIRNDRYMPLGTAFAISPTEYVTAAHVLSLMDDSELYPQAFIRDKNGQVFPIDRILSFHEHKDFVVFSVEGRRSDRYLETRAGFEANEQVYAVGNIYGQGLVAVPGTILGSLPEEEDGAWVYIKSSPPNDRGSSGGPLLDNRLNVIGIITHKDDTFGYSLPMSETENVKESTGFFHRPTTFGFELLPGRSSREYPFDIEVPLPKKLAEVRRAARERYAPYYAASMEDFLRPYLEELRPDSATFAEALQGSSDSNGIQVLFKDKDSGKWQFSALEKSRSSLSHNGGVFYATTGEVALIDLQKPDNVSHRELYSDPQRAMDLILEGISMPRQFAGQDIRILSFGSPREGSSYLDAYGRRWDVNIWHIEYSDGAAILYSTPVPDGLIGLLTFCSYSDRQSWRFDLDRIADLTCIPYFGTLKDWTGFLGQTDRLYGPLASARLDYLPGGAIHLEAGNLHLDLDSGPLAVSDGMTLSLSHDFFLDRGKVVWGLRRLGISEEDRDNYTVVYRYNRPPADLDRSYLNEWSSIVRREHPFNETPYQDQGRTNIGTILTSSPQQEACSYTLFLGKVGSVDPDQLRTQLQRLKGGLRIDP